MVREFSFANNLREYGAHPVDCELFLLSPSQGLLPITLSDSGMAHCFRGNIWCLRGWHCFIFNISARWSRSFKENVKISCERLRAIIFVIFLVHCQEIEADFQSTWMVRNIGRYCCKRGNEQFEFFSFYYHQVYLYQLNDYSHRQQYGGVTKMSTLLQALGSHTHEKTRKAWLFNTFTINSYQLY